MTDYVHAHCPVCGEAVEVPLRVTSVNRTHNLANETEALFVHADGAQVHFCNALEDQRNKREVNGL